MPPPWPFLCKTESQPDKTSTGHEAEEQSATHENLPAACLVTAAAMPPCSLASLLPMQSRGSISIARPAFARGSSLREVVSWVRTRHSTGVYEPAPARFPGPERQEGPDCPQASCQPNQAEPIRRVSDGGNVEASSATSEADRWRGKFLSWCLDRQQIGREPRQGRGRLAAVRETKGNNERVYVAKEMKHRK